MDRSDLRASRTANRTFAININIRDKYLTISSNNGNFARNAESYHNFTEIGRNGGWQDQAGQVASHQLAGTLQLLPSPIVSWITCWAETQPRASSPPNLFAERVHRDFNV